MAKPRYCPPQPLETFVRRIFEEQGAKHDIASEVARHLVRANLSGHDSHGVRLVPKYVSQMDSGEFVPSARPVILRETEVTALVDAQRGIGHYSTAWALDWAMECAPRHGLAAVAIRHSNHIGRVGEYVERAGERGLVAIVTCGAGGPGVGGMVLYGTRQRFLGANPWAIGIPAEGRPPMVFDGSTSTVAEGKVRVARDKGEPLPPHCITNSQGIMSTNPDDFFAGGALLPLGSPAAGHKGYGLALASVLLSGLAMVNDPDPTLIGGEIHGEFPDARGRVAGVFLIVIDPSAFGEADAYKAMAAEMLAAAKRVPPVEGVAEVVIPGEPEQRMREQRSRKGIPLPETVWQELSQVGKRFGLAIPEPVDWKERQG